MEPAHTIQELIQFQAMPLEVKIAMTKVRVRDWVNYFGVNGVYVSFSGGKDSTVLLHIVRELFPDVPAVFVDTGLEYPEIRQFVKTFSNVVWLKPAMNFRQVIERYGYPFISKEVAHKFHDMNSAHNHGRTSYVDAQLEGTYKSKRGHQNMIAITQWRFLKDANFRISHKCCDVMKKAPTGKYERETGRHPMTGQMAAESFLRTQVWLRNGCNAFEGKRPKSNPLSFWTEQDVLSYIKKYEVPIASVYGDIVPYTKNELEGQMDIADYGLTEDERPLKTTGCDRTGCMFCGFGCHLEPAGAGRFEKIRVNYPQIYDYIMRPTSEGGLNYKEIIDWLNAHGDLHIKY